MLECSFSAGSSEQDEAATASGPARPDAGGRTLHRAEEGGHGDNLDYIII